MGNKKMNTIIEIKYCIKKYLEPTSVANRLRDIPGGKDLFYQASYTPKYNVVEVTIECGEKELSQELYAFVVTAEKELKDILVGYGIFTYLESDSELFLED